MILKNLSPFFADDYAYLCAYRSKPSLWPNEIDAAIASYERDEHADTLIGFVQKARRLIRIFVCGLENDQHLAQKIAGGPLTDWETFAEPPVPHVWQDRLADMLYVVRDTEEMPLLEVGDQARYIAVKLFERCAGDKLAFDINVHDENFFTLLTQAVDEKGLTALADHALQSRDKITARILVKHNMPEWIELEGDQQKLRTYRALMQPWREKVLSGRMRSVLTTIPTRRDAQVDGIDYQNYAELYFRMCDQPWDLIKSAQYALIEKLNAGKALRFINNDGTDLTMSIDGFTFCNSVVARNIPGSEVFSAPEITSTNGTIVAKGQFSARDEASAVMENLTLSFKDGILISASAEEGQEHLDKALSVDDGAKRIGEIGIGTNPYLKRHVASILLSEKIGGSFHVALGDAYTMTDYMGDPVRVDNGNRSQLHWDITTMLYGKQGQIILDDTPIMKDGLWLDPALEVLNRGWQAVPFDARPPEWQKIYTD